MYLRKRAEDGPFEVYTDTASRLEMYRRIRKMFLWAFCIVFLCSFSVWSLLFREPGSIFARGLGGVYIVMLATMLRAVRQCTRRIRELEKE